MFNLFKNDLLEATKDNNIITVKKLIKNVNIDYKDKNHKTAIFYAIENQNLELVKLLVECGANLNMRDDRGLMPIHYAIIVDNIEIINYLHRKQCHIDLAMVRDDINGLTLRDKRYFFTLIKKLF